MHLINIPLQFYVPLLILKSNWWTNHLNQSSLYPHYVPNMILFPYISTSLPITPLYIISQNAIALPQIYPPSEILPLQIFPLLCNISLSIFHSCFPLNFPCNFDLMCFQNDTFIKVVSYPNNSIKIYSLRSSEASAP